MPPERRHRKTEPITARDLTPARTPDPLRLRFTIDDNFVPYPSSMPRGGEIPTESKRQPSSTRRPTQEPYRIPKYSRTSSIPPSRLPAVPDVREPKNPPPGTLHEEAIPKWKFPSSPPRTKLPHQSRPALEKVSQMVTNIPVEPAPARRAPPGLEHSVPGKLNGQPVPCFATTGKRLAPPPDDVQSAKKSKLLPSALLHIPSPPQKYPAAPTALEEFRFNEFRREATPVVEKPIPQHPEGPKVAGSKGIPVSVHNEPALPAIEKTQLKSTEYTTLYPTCNNPLGKQPRRALKTSTFSPPKLQDMLPIPLVEAIPAPRCSAPKLLFRAFHSGSSGQNSRAGFKTVPRLFGPQDSRYVTESLKLHFDKNNRTPTCWISTTDNLLGAINRACNMQNEGKQGVAIAVIDCDKSIPAEPVLAEHLSMLYRIGDGKDPSLRMAEWLWPYLIPKRGIVACLLLQTLVDRGLYTVVPAFDPGCWKGPVIPAETMREEVRTYILLRGGYGPWADAGTMAGKVAIMFGEGDHTEYIAREVFWWRCNTVVLKDYQAREAGRAVNGVLRSRVNREACFDKKG